MAFAQNTRDEVRLIDGDGQVTAALGAEQGSHQTTRILQTAISGDCAGTLDANYGKGPGSANFGEREVVACVPLRVGVVNVEAGLSAAGNLRLRDICEPLTATEHKGKLNGDRGNPGVSVNDEVAFCLPANPMSDRGQQVLPPRGVVRRLTPVECERLQGFPDDYTQIPWKGKPPTDCPDGPRYKALGNSMAVPVMRWIERPVMFTPPPEPGLPWGEITLNAFLLWLVVNLLLFLVGLLNELFFKGPQH